MNQFKIVDLSEVTFVSDRGTNFLKALKRFQAYSCIAHRLNNIVKHCFFVNEKNKNQEDSMDSAFGYEDNKVEEDIETLIDTAALNDVPRRALHTRQNVIECKKLVKYVKQVSLHLYVGMNRYYFGKDLSINKIFSV